MCKLHIIKHIKLDVLVYFFLVIEFGDFKSGEYKLKCSRGGVNFCLFCACGYAKYLSRAGCTKYHADFILLSLKEYIINIIYFY